MTENNDETRPEETDDESMPHRRLVDKINAAALHAFDQGGCEIAATLKQLHSALIEQEVAEGYDKRSEDRSDAKLNKWLDHRYKNKS
ncbi:MAG: hypothetical protein VCD50_12905 [Alphaproteobacteria bacterium]|jgi:hypothetical protein